jgi:putative transcriptional regulator
MTKSKIENEIIEGLKQAVAHERGEIKLRTTIRELPPPAPKWTSTKVKKLRIETYHMSQPQFAALLNVKVPTVRAWEQGQKTPSGSAARLLEIFMLDQEVVKKLIAA